MRVQDKPEGSGGSEEHDAIPSDLSIDKKKEKRRSSKNSGISQRCLFLQDMKDDQLTLVFMQL